MEPEKINVAFRLSVWINNGVPTCTPGAEDCALQHAERWLEQNRAHRGARVVQQWIPLWQARIQLGEEEHQRRTIEVRVRRSAKSDKRMDEDLIQIVLEDSLRRKGIPEE
jgi:hypothetical protein